MTDPVDETNESNTMHGTNLFLYNEGCSGGVYKDTFMVTASEFNNQSPLSPLVNVPRNYGMDQLSPTLAPDEFLAPIDAVELAPHAIYQGASSTFAALHLKFVGPENPVSTAAKGSGGHHRVGKRLISADARVQAKRDQNRKSQNAFRMRKIAKVTELEAQLEGVPQLIADLEMAKEHNKLQREYIKILEDHLEIPPHERGLSNSVLALTTREFCYQEGPCI